jgi:hypothetical protein
MKTVLLLLLAATANAQWSDFSTLTASSNLASAMNGKTNIQIATSGACSTKAGTAGKDFCWDTVALFQCTVTGSPGTWTQVVTAASGNAPTSSAFVSTPTLCSTGQAPTGILANGNATGCASLGSGSSPNWTSLNGACSQTNVSNIESCLRCTLTSTQYSTASGTSTVTLGTMAAHAYLSDWWGRETTTFSGTGMTTSSVGISSGGTSAPTVGLKQATNTVTAGPLFIAPSDSATSVSAVFTILTGGGTWNNASGTYDLQVCSRVGR